MIKLLGIRNKKGKYWARNNADILQASNGYWTSDFKSAKFYFSEATAKGTITKCLNYYNNTSFVGAYISEYTVALNRKIPYDHRLPRFLA